jgi:hypothetical protein
MKELDAREVQRYQLTSDLSVVYEGATEEIPVYRPDLSTRGMFVHTPRAFPLGSILKIQFRLQRSQFQVSVRAEVRRCEPGAGVGVEFLDLSPAAMMAIEREIGVR